MKRFEVKPEDVRQAYARDFMFVYRFDTLEEAVEVCGKLNKKARRGLCVFFEVVDLETEEVVYHD